MWTLFVCVDIIRSMHLSIFLLCRAFQAHTPGFDNVEQKFIRPNSSKTYPITVEGNLLEFNYVAMWIHAQDCRYTASNMSIIEWSC